MIASVRTSDCRFCGSSFSFLYCGKGSVRVSCDACRTNTAKTERWRAKNYEKVREYKAEWARRNGDKQRAWAKRYYRENTKKVQLRSAVYRDKNKERIAAWMRDYRAKRPGPVVASELRRRARWANAPGRASAGQIAARFAFFGDRCAYCRGPAESIDHVIPLSKGGTHWPANIRPACLKCNASKRDKTLGEWVA